MAAHAICFNFITSHSFALAAYKNPLNRTFERTFLNFCDYDSEIAINVAEKLRQKYYLCGVGLLNCKNRHIISISMLT